MKKHLSIAALVAVLLLSGCAGTFTTDFPAPVDPAVSREWRVAGVRVGVPEARTVSEDNLLVPAADIVWHGEGKGDRKAQVAAILREGMAQGAAGLTGTRPVILYASVRRFHGVTPVAINRAPGAVHDITYTLWAIDAQTGRTIAGPARVEADMLAYTQTRAVLSAIDGETERARLVDHIAAVTAGWLGTGPDPRGSFVSIGR